MDSRPAKKARAADPGEAVFADVDAACSETDLLDRLQEAEDAHEGGARSAAAYQRDSDGQSVMMAAAASGLAKHVQILLQHGAPWNALDRKGRCAGQYALSRGHQAVVDMLVNAGVMAELVFGAVERRRGSGKAPPQEIGDNKNAVAATCAGADAIVAADVNLVRVVGNVGLQF